MNPVCLLTVPDYMDQITVVLKHDGIPANDY